MKIFGGIKTKDRTDIPIRPALLSYREITEVGDPRYRSAQSSFEPEIVALPLSYPSISFMELGAGFEPASTMVVTTVLRNLFYSYEPRVLQPEPQSLALRC